MKYSKVFILLATSLLPVAASAADFKVVANSSVIATSISADELKGVFLVVKTTLADGSHVVPVIMKDGPTHEAFIKQCLGKSESGLQAYYRAMLFTGKAKTPKTLDDDAAVTTYVSKTKGAIGYVSSGASTTGVRVLTIN